MSDPAKSAAEIEDVLTSIRRLVSEGGPVDRRPAEAAGKLVLTPALRVAEPDDPWAPVPEAADAADPPPDAKRDEPDGGDDPAWGLEDRLADWGEIEESAQEAIADAIAGSGKSGGPRQTRTDARMVPAGLSVAKDAFDLSGLAPLDADVASEVPAGGFEPETGDADWPDPGADSALRDLAAARFGVAAPEPVKAGTSQEGATDPGTPAAGVDPHDGDRRTVDHPVAAAPGAEGNIGQEAAPEPAAFTPMFSRRPDRAPHRRDADAAVETGGTAHKDDDDIEDLGEALSPFSFPDAEDGILDEETLREIVAEVVRQELQGALGQRITRNVRKMVRREIRLALAADDLE